MTGHGKESGVKFQIALNDPQPPVFDLYRSGAKVSGEPVLVSPPQDISYDSGKMYPRHGNIGHGQHQRPVRKATLRPRIFFRKRSALIPLPVSAGIPKGETLVIDVHGSADSMFHAPNAVTAFHKRHEGERSHNVIC